LLFEKRPFPVVRPPLLTAEERRERAQWWATFFWAMAPIAVKYAARGAVGQAFSQIALLGRSLVCLIRLTQEKEGPNPWFTSSNRLLEPEIDRRIPRLGKVVTPEACLEVIRRCCEEMSTIEASLLEMGVETYPQMRVETERLTLIASEAIQRGEFPAARFR
jgi:hypothetical protein